MSNDITTHATTEDIFAKFANEASSIQGGGDGKAFMKFNGMSGKYSYGAEDHEIDLSSQFVMNPLSYSRGYVTWVAGKVVNQTMVKITQGAMPSISSLPDNGPYAEGDGPVEQYTVELAMVEEPFAEMIFQANNGSKRRAFGSLMKSYADQYKNHPGKFPVISIDETEFKTKAKNGRETTMHAPIFKIVHWLSTEEMEALKEGTPGDYEAPALEDQSDDTAPAPVKPAAKPAVAPKAAAPARAKGRF